MFSIVYGLFALFGKAGWEIEKSIDNKQSRNRARKNNRDIYIDKEGCERLVNNNQKIITRRNLFGEVMRCDFQGNVISVENKRNEDHYSEETVKLWIEDKYGNPKLWDNTIPSHKNFHWNEKLYKDISTGKCLVIARLRLDGKERTVKGGSLVKKHLFYLDPVTLKLIRETDGEKELRKIGSEDITPIEEINSFIKRYNKKIDDAYNPCFSGWECGYDISIDYINQIKQEINKRKEI